MGTTPKCRFLLAFNVGSCHGPLTIIAALPAMNWSLTSDWVQVTTDLETEPDVTRFCSSVSAATAWGESSCLRSAPPVQKNGSNCQVPSSVLAALNARPYCEPWVSFLAAVDSSSQVVGGVSPALVNRSVL